MRGEKKKILKTDPFSDDFLEGFFLGRMMHGGSGPDAGCCGPGCLVMMLTFPVLLLFGFVKEKSGSRKNRNKQEV